ncbi:MAG: amino acid adenylation domain-containing protein, partial [Acidobacteria bacterium]|nr:amino acid adenylation domain-containing protein [Acidobacteriota bacterium]
MKLKSKGIENILPLTPLQEGIFFHYLKDPQSNLYFEQLSLEISSAIDVDLFEKAWNVVIQANEMLRTVFRWEKLEKPSQIILKEHPCQIRFHDFSDIDSEQKQIVLAKIKTNDRNEGFDLTQVPFRVTLCKLAEIHYEMIISNHHILYDGWSNGIILKEFFKAYHELCQGGRAIRLPVKPSFKEFIKWIQSLDKNKQEQFWRNYLAGFETASELPIKRKKAGITGADNYSIILEETIKNQLEAFVKNNRVTLASVFYSAWGILLQKYCGSEDVVFGTTVSGRSADVKGIEDMVGLFINTIPLRIDTYPGEKIIAVVSQIDHVLHEREGFENTPLVDIQSYSSLGGNGSLFDTILVIENYPLDNRLLPANSSFSIHSYSIVEMSHYDLSVGIMLFNEIEIKFSFKQELFEKETIENLAVHFKIIIQKMIEQPEMTLSQLGIISIEEKYRILYEFNNTAVEYPRDKTIHQLFAEQAAQTPGAIALVARETRTEKQEEKKRRREEEKNGDVETLRATSLQYQYQISYSQLNEQSDRLADLLIGKGVLPDTIVGIMMERSIEMITGIFGILKSGGAYLPIDPGYPQERINYMLKDSSAAILLINLELERMNNCQCSIVNCQLSTGESPGNFQHSAFELPLIQHSNHLAYIIYTSGSTGRPKGVMINHRNVVRLVKGTNYIEFLPGDSILQTGAMEFDASTFEVWGSLLNGLKLVLVNKETILIPGKLKAVLGVFAVSTIWMTSQLFNQMLQEDSEIFAGLKNLLVGGDVLSPSHIGRLKSKYPRLNVINGYGPTENTTFSTTFPIQDEYTANIPVGKPVANSTAYIVDRYNQLQPIGVPGELLVGGDGVARGYLNNPELTAFKFISVASVASVAKIYKTGDLARWLPDSNIEFLGRIDQQVKIRGFRIELGEIENRLAKHPGIKDAVVINQEENSEDKYLCAYFISNEEIAISGLRNFLARELPNYMIPSHFVQLKKIPLTPNGKLDREALPKPELKAGENYIAPRDEIETKLAVIWSEVLLIKTPIGIDDHFFQLGGHSLKATILASRIEKTFNVKILLAEIFRNPKIRELSKYIKDAAQLQYLQMEPAEKKEYYVLSSAQKRLYFLQQMDKEGTTYNIPYFMILEGIIDKNNLEHSIQQLIKSHESLRTSFVIIDEEPVQRIHEEVEFEIEYFATDELSQHGRTRIFLNYFIRPFDLSCAPLLRVGLVKMAEEKHLFLVDMHHIISDGISTQVLVQDFSDFYTGKELPGIKLQYRDYAEWQNRGRVSENIREQGKYWKKEYEGEIPVLALHNDYARPIVQVFEGDRITFEINSEISGTLKALVLELQATLYIVLLALYTILLSRLTGQEDIVIGSPVAGRRHPDLEKIIGMFVNTLALRNYPSGEKTFKGFLAEVRERTLEAFENQEFQYEDLVEQILVNRDAGRNPLFDTMFAIKNAGARKIELPGLNAVPVEYENKTAKFDLSLAGMEVEDKLSFTLEYNTKLFKRKTIENMSDYFKNMINHIILNPDVKISDVELISDETRKAQLTYLNANLKENFEAKPIQTILSDSFQKFKQNIAIEYGAVRLTYAELEHRAACISQLLAQNNIEKESFIGVYCKDKANIISAAIGILDRASIFVPLDVNLPVKRVEIAIKLADIRVILTDTGLEAILDDMKERNPNIGHIFVITGSFYQAHELDTAKAQNTRYNLEDKVYVYFTSGTTGVPNVIMGKNESLVQFLTWEIEKFSIHEGYRISQLTAVGFDAFLRDIFVPLFVGGTVCIPSPMDIERLVDWLDSNHINLVHCVPSVFRLFNVGELTGINFAHLKYILISGEPLKPNELKRWYKIFGNRIQLVNYYGPSETTMIKTYHFIRSGEAEAERIPAGLPMRGARIIILDKYLKLCGKGIVGEIYIRTPYRTYGYLNEPELNAERFIKNPLQHDDMTLLHKTGDFGKELENGEIEVLGRVDRQIKIRGVRIELENIENCLLKHDKIEKAILINRKDKNDDNYLCAYIVYKKEVFPDTGKLRSTQALREHLAKELPEYMIPSYFVPIETVPLTPNGKIDTKALALLDHEIKTDDGYIAPRNALEEKLVESWEEILGIDKGLIGIDANFFQLGGHSLKVTILLSRIHREMNVRVPMTEMFKAPTVRGLSAYIHGAGGDVSLAVEPSEAKEYYVLSSAQKRLYFLQQMDKAVTAYNIPSGWILAGAIDKYRLEQSIKKLILRHESLRTSFHMSNDETVQRVHDEVEFEIEKLDGRVDPLWSSFIRPFDLSHAPLLRVGLVKLAVEKHILLVDMHHIISDGTSINVLVQDFFALFTGEELPEIKVQYKDYAQWQYRARVSEEILEQGEYWEKQYEGEIPILELPFDYARLPIQSFEGNRINFEINRETSGALNTLALEAGATLYIVLLTIYTIFLTKLSNCEDIVIGSPIAGRRHADLEKVIGMFVNTLALRNYPSGEKKFTDFLKEVKEKTIKAFENQEYQFEDLVEKLYITRNLSRNPIFDTLFVLQNTGSQRIELPGLKLVPYEYENKTSKFDLSLSGMEMEGKLMFVFEFCTKLFKRETIERFTIYFKNIARRIVENKNQRISDLEILTEEEKNRILYEFNNTATAYPRDKTIHQLFVEQEERIPDHIAIVGGSIVETLRATSLQYQYQMSYRQLNEQSNRLAGLLIEKGVLPDTIVGIMIERSIEMIIGILGILKSGGAYLPIDPDYPQERIDYMLKDSGAALLAVANDQEGEKVRRWEGENVLLESIDHSSNYSLLQHSAFSIQQSKNLAYIIYTSGTTGNPKGVLIEHKNVVRLLFNDQFQFDFNEQDVWSLFHSTSFDFSVWEIYGALLYGGRLVVIPKMTARDPQQFLKVLIEQKV